MSTQNVYIDGEYQSSGGGGAGGSSDIFSTIVSAKLTADVSYPASTNNVIVFDTADINLNSAYNTTTGVFTAPADGIYEATGSVNIEGLKNGADYRFILYNTTGVFTLAQPRLLNTNETITRKFLNMSPRVFELSAGDTIEFRYFHTQSTNSVLDGFGGFGSKMQIKRLK